MTSLIGTRFLQGIILMPETASSDLSGWDHIPLSTDVVEAGRSLSGSKNEGSRTAYPRDSFQGATTHGTEQEFYGDIIVSPTKLNLGFVLSAQIYTLGIWNLTGRDQILLDWSTSNLENVTISNADGCPVRFGSGAYRPYLVTVQPSGSAQISGTISFRFEDSDRDLSIPVTGTRLVVFSFEPNWRESPIESLEWLTDVLSSYDKTEQRLSLRQNPRRAMKYLFSFETQNKVNTFEGLLWNWQPWVFALPIWQDWQPLGATLPAGSASISVSTVLRDFQAGGLAIIWRDYLTWEVVEIQSLTTAELGLSKTTLSDWRPTDRIIPMRYGRLVKTLDVQRPTSRLAEATLSFSFEVGSTVGSNRIGSTSWLQYQGLDVLTLPPNVADDPDQTAQWDREFDAIDAGIGSWDVYDHAGAPAITRPYSWLLTSRSDIATFLAFLETRRGRCVPFWMPDWSWDLEMAQAMGATDLNIVVKNIGYTRHTKNHANRSTLIFFPADRSTPIIKTITGASEGANNTEILSLDSSFGAIKTASDFRAISFLTYGRMDQDAFDITWFSGDTATVAFNVREVLL